MSKATAGERLRRLLAIVPWIVANPGVSIAAVADRFGLTETELVKDLQVVWMVGLPPYTPDALVEVVMEEGCVWIHYADFFSRPLRLTPEQGLALLASSDGLLSLPGTDPTGPLARALTKVSKALGVEPDEAIDVDLAAAGSEHLEVLRTAIGAQTEVDLEYFSYARDAVTSRRIAPWRLTADSGAWYVEAWCHLAGGERIFRLDRISSLEPTNEATDRPAPETDDAQLTFHLQEAEGRVTLLLQPGATWVVDSYPCEAVEAHDDGSVTTTLAVSTVPWLERLLLRLGPEAEVISEHSFDGAAALGSIAARRVLSRYQG